MVLTSLNQKYLIIFFIALFLCSFIWYQLPIAPTISSVLQKVILQNKEVLNMTTANYQLPIDPTILSVIQNKRVKNMITATTTIIPTEEKKEKETVILIWNWPWGSQFPLDGCSDYGITGCKLSIDRRLYSSADAVVIHHADIMYDKNSLPQQPRPLYQYWVWYNMEPPLIISNLDMLDNLFNLTLTFRLDSDIYFPYGHTETLKEPQNFTIPTKSKLVSWVVSKWYPGISRIAYYEELKKHIPIDVYGKKHTKLDWKDFHSTLSQYKFYLSFENSNYKDYITEKLWSNAFGSGSVPVVLGTSRENYERFVPGDSFIHVDDFPSAKELAAYLLELDKDDEKYRKYFNWRSHYCIKMARWNSYPYCKTCKVIQEAPKYQVIHSVAKWFLGKV